MSEKKSRRTIRRGLRGEVLEPRILLAGDITMFNDTIAGSLTHPNATAFASNGTSSGFLRDVDTGDITNIQLQVIDNGVGYAGSSQFPADGTDADLIFGGRIDFSPGTGASLELQGGDTNTQRYSGLNPLRAYEFAGTAIRGNTSYTDRWSLVTLVGADAFTSMHTSGDGIVTAGLAANQVAVWTGSNHEPGQGYVAHWSEIDPGADGEFEIVTQQYTGSIPTSVDGGGVANGSKGYGLSAIRLIESSSLDVESAIPADGEVVGTAPNVIRLTFDDDIDPNTLDATDLTVDGVPAVAALPAGLNGAEWFLSPPPTSGTHTVQIAEGAVASVGGELLGGYESTFTIATLPSVENAPPVNIGATTATLAAVVTSTGFDNPTLEIFYGQTDGGTDANAWDGMVVVEDADIGLNTANATNLAPTANYFYRARVTNVAGSAWASSAGTFSTPSPMAATLVMNGATEISAFSARASGNVIDTGGDPPNIQLYYGRTDGGINAAGWESSINLGTQSAGFDTLLEQLDPNTQYFYRARANNLSGSSWAPNSISFTTDLPASLRINEIAGGDSDILPTRIRIDSSQPFQGDERTPDWIEIYNPTSEAINLGGYALTDDSDELLKWQFPTSIVIPANDYLVVFASGENLRDPAFDESGRLHTNFGLNNSGEYLALVGGNEVVVDEYSPEFPRLYEGFTLGLDSIGNDAYFSNPTPDAVNDDSSIVPGFVADTEFSQDRGFYDGPITVNVTSATPGASIVYTTDGSDPTLSNGTRVDAPNASTTPTAPVNITTTTVLRARAYFSDWIETNIDTQTYLFLNDVIEQPVQPSGWPSSWGGAPVADYEMDPEIVDDPNYSADLLEGLREIPSISLVSDLDNFFGGSGIYSNTNDGNLEIVTSAEMILGDGTSAFQIDAGLKIQGGGSRNPNNTPKHNLSLRFRDSIDDGKVQAFRRF